MLALTVLAAAIGVTLATTTANADSSGGQGGHKHESRSSSSPGVSGVLDKTTEGVTKTLTSTVDATSKSLTGQDQAARDRASQAADRPTADGTSSDKERSDTAEHKTRASDHQRSSDAADAHPTSESAPTDSGKINESGKINNDDSSTKIDKASSAGGAHNDRSDVAGEIKKPDGNDTATAEADHSSSKIDETSRPDTSQSLTDTTDSVTEVVDHATSAADENDANPSVAATGQHGDDHNGGDQNDPGRNDSDQNDATADTTQHDDTTGSDASTTAATTESDVPVTRHEPSATDLDGATANSAPADDKAAPEPTSGLAHASHSDATPTITLGEIADDAVVRPAADLVTAAGESHPTSTVVDTAAGLTSAASRPSHLVPETVDAVADLSPDEIRPVVDQLGDTTTQLTDPVTEIADSAVGAVAPVVPVSDVLDSAAVTLEESPTESVDSSVRAITQPAAGAVNDSGQVLRSVAAVPLPRKPVDDLSDRLGDVSGAATDGVSGVADVLAGGLRDVSAVLTPATEAVGEVGHGVSEVIDQTRDRVITPLPIAPLPLPDVSPPTSGGLIDGPAPSLSLPALGLSGSEPLSQPTRILPNTLPSTPPSAIIGTAGQFLRLAPTGATTPFTSEIRKISDIGSALDHRQAELLASPRFLASAITTVRDLGRAPETTDQRDTTDQRGAEIRTDGSRDNGPLTSFHGLDAAPATGGSSGSGAAAGGAGAGAAHPASTISWLSLLATAGTDRGQWDHEAETTRTTFDPGFSPD